MSRRLVFPETTPASPENVLKLPRKGRWRRSCEQCRASKKSCDCAQPCGRCVFLAQRPGDLHRRAASDLCVFRTAEAMSETDATPTPSEVHSLKEESDATATSSLSTRLTAALHDLATACAPLVAAKTHREAAEYKTSIEMWVRQMAVYKNWHSTLLRTRPQIWR
jgi:hypothetical protein